MGILQRCTDAILAATDEEHVRHAVAEYVSHFPAEIFSMPPAIRDELGAPTADIQRSAAVIRRADSSYVGKFTTGVFLRDVSSIYSAAASRLNQLQPALANQP